MRVHGRAIEGGKDQQGACFSNANNNLDFARQNQDYLLFPILTDNTVSSVVNCLIS